MKKIWNSESQSHLYAIDEQQLAENIRKKKKRAGRMVNRLEWFLMLVTVGVGLFLLTENWMENAGDPFAYILSGFMLVMGGVIYFRHRLRISREKRFDRSILGDLKHAISSATYQVQLSYLMLLFLVPLTLLVLLSAWQNGKPLWFLLAIIGGFVLFFFAARWEHRSLHVARKRRLEEILEKLTQENGNE